ncbi:transcriptional repressor CTCFL [Hyalella azteca]|uniref:CCCTC-binding factor n=1 Tax=Hyalella azteca TaxID=294128 RepID=A0A8B7NLH0_HYAAZ|nr:transcriptional repressor CTCFL [Hyalella azteca]XP_018014515.1 transcriptional repressor CTCFL [Hyalella azteca]
MDDCGETISDIQNYLSSFNKEIQQVDSHISSGEVAQVFIDEAGRYYYQPLEGAPQQVVVVTEDDEQDGDREVEEHTISSGDNSNITHTVVISEPTQSVSGPSKRPVTSGTADGSGSATAAHRRAPSSTKSGRVSNEVQTKDGEVADQLNLCNESRVITIKNSGLMGADGAEDDEALQSLAGAIASVGEDGLLQLREGSASGANQVILNTGNSNQIVTIVPSTTNPGEMSYVLIVEQNANDGGGDKDHTVYDFTEGEDAFTFSDDEEDPPPRSGVLINSNSGSNNKQRSAIRRSQSTGSQAHMCNYCNYTSTKRYLLIRHMRSHSEERPHKCSVCERGFKTLGSLQNHLNTHTGVKPHRCKFCDTGFTTSGELVRHVRYIHTQEKPHKCPECHYSSVELSKLKRHMRCHTGERPYQCIHCTYASPDTFKLKRHLRIHTGEKPYECDICHARFTQSNSLKAHKLIHTGSKPVYTCELCPTTCGRKTDLRIHIQKLHTSDKPIKCKKCTKIFPDRYTFKLHNKTHDGEKCFKCDLCPYASTSSRHLDSHMLVHTEQKPYRCEMCEQSFRQKQLLRRHQNLYHNPQYIPPAPREKTQECPECGKAFRHKGNLIRHMAIHDPDASAQEKSQALKLGRQKRLQLINGQQVEVYGAENDTTEDEDQLMSVEGDDGNQYVVLEVIQLAGGEGHHVMVGGEDLPLHSDGSLLPASPLVVSQDDPAINPTILGLQQPLLPDDIKKETKKEMDTCFGFDEDGDTGQIHLQFGE